MCGMQLSAAMLCLLQTPLPAASETGQLVNVELGSLSSIVQNTGENDRLHVKVRGTDTCSGALSRSFYQVLLALKQRLYVLCNYQAVTTTAFVR